ncbi:Hok/Gef family protein [Salmonella enterica]|uniref:Hok/Gef family protein n=1 Tax=Salmonella enterica TaxID=28901 RepID=UPI00137E840C|nr:Hok/Gef family protein [Salmonella enterica]EBW8860942.1 Hok/Gef family protein [Salmonella enterica subsp. enterica serovar Muenchen]ECF5937304.1 Hok/Gef family protein [Salmonella enterica subsp. diarizonae]EAP7866743.1 Hok/Gef family protein [Salmonella enterica]EAQ1546734.1 Hok/Gef family protein [Salmonella enterica]
MEPQKLALIALIVVGAACLGALLLGNKHLCDVSFRSGKTEIVAHMAYESR